MPKTRSTEAIKTTPMSKRYPHQGNINWGIGKRKRDSSSEESSLSKRFGQLSTASKPAPKRLKSVPGGGILDFDEADDDPISMYFEAFSKPAQKTSTTTIADLNLPSKNTLRKWAAGEHSTNDWAREELLKTYERDWDQWVFFLQNGFNLLFTGFGSKKSLIEEFCMTKLNFGGLIVVNGYFKGMNVSSILTGISEKVLKGKVSRGRDNFSSVNNICSHMTQNRPLVERIILVVHNIDSENLSSRESQYLLALLSNHPRIHLIASIDNYNAELLWGSRTLELFSWFRCQTPTFKPYLDIMQESPEKGYLTDTINDSSRMARGVNHVLASLTPNHVDILKALGEECVEQQVDGLTFRDWLDISEEQMLTSADVQFRQLLEELVEHELVLKRKFKGDEESKFYIPANVLEYLDLDT